MGLQIFKIALSVAQVATLVSHTGDTEVSKRIQNPGDIAHLQLKFNAIYRWVEENNKLFNVEEFQTLLDQQGSMKNNKIH